jgi:hypothetical protein
MSNDAALPGVAYVSVRDTNDEFENAVEGRTKSVNGTNGHHLNGDIEEGADKPLVGEDKIAYQKRQKRALCCSMLTLILSIPALIGA